MLEYLYHATPLQYVPQIMADDALFAQSVLASRGIAPREGAARRDRMVGVADYVHLSLLSQTPLLADKLNKGYPHAVIAFDRRRVLDLPEIALLPYNTKAWNTKSALTPIVEEVQKARLLTKHGAGKRYQSLEVLVKYGLSMEYAARIIYLTARERNGVRLLLANTDGLRDLPHEVDRSAFPAIDAYEPVTLAGIEKYLCACRSAGRVLPPAALPFD